MQLTPVTGTYKYSVRTEAAASLVDHTVTADPLVNAPLRLDLTNTVTSSLVPGSISFTFSGKTYFERNGKLYVDLQPDGTGTEAGTIDYTKGEATVTRWVNGAALGIAVLSCLTKFGNFTTTSATFRTAGSPLRSASAYVQASQEDGTLLTATANSSGVLIGDHARGTVNDQMGIVHIEWGDMVVAAGNEAEPWFDASKVVGGSIWKPRLVLPGTIRYNCVVLSNLPLNADILGLDPIRLPSDGRVPIFRPADVVVIHNTKTFALPNPPVAGSTYPTGRTDLSELWLTDANGVRVASSQFAVNLGGGSVTMAADMDLSTYALPLTVHHRIEQVDQLSDVQINGQLTLTGPLSRDFDGDTLVSSALLFGDMFARVANVFDQATWDNTWQDSRRGQDATATFNSVDYPVVVLNDGAVNERWRINFIGTSSFQVIGENLGVIATGTTNADIAPVNGLTGKPYFTLRAAGWGGGWVIGNQLRFNTIGATAPIWISRTVLPGATLSGDSLDLQLRGDVDA